jgi:outer membrane protein assembly factor BamD
VPVPTAPPSSAVSGLTLRKIREVALLLLLAGWLAGCASLQEDPTANWSASQLYGEAKRALESGDYTKAVQYYETLEARYPFGRFAQQAQIEVAYAYYRAEESEAALLAVDRFMQLNPRHPNLDYAYYLRGLIHFKRNQGLFERLFPLDPSEMDARPLTEAFQDFGRLLREFPDSLYAENARERMLFIRDALAANEVRIALFYADREAWVATAARARQVLELYAGASVTPQALILLYRSYTALGLQEQADDSLAVLALNYPEFVALAQSGQRMTIRQAPGGVRTWLERLPFFAQP